MKKMFIVFLILLLSTFLAACGTNEQTQSDNKDTTAKVVEPDGDTLCAFCNMKVYQKDEAMGVFTAHAITADQEELFFDDSGCLLNYERKTGESYEKKWVRDFISSEWISAKDATPIHADISTPMKYGYAFFKDKEDAEAFIKDNPDVNGELTSWDSIDQEANTRYMKKMQMQNSSDK